MLKAEDVKATVMFCMFHAEEVENNMPKPGIEYVEVEGIAHNYVLHKQRLLASREKVLECIKELDGHFFLTGGGGWSFLRLPFDKNGSQWGEHIHAEGLAVLAIGLGLAKYLTSRDLWPLFPGEVPYILFGLEELP